AIVAAYGGLRAFLARQDGVRLLASSAAFGVAVSGMHYTAMYGMHFVPVSDAVHHHMPGLAASQQSLSIVVSLLCFVIAAGFLLSLVPDSRRQPQMAAAGPVESVAPGAEPAPVAAAATPIAVAAPRLMPAPLGGLGQPPRTPAP